MAGLKKPKRPKMPKKPKQNAAAEVWVRYEDNVKAKISEHKKKMSDYEASLKRRESAKKSAEKLLSSVK